MKRVLVIAITAGLGLTGVCENSFAQQTPRATAPTDLNSAHDTADRALTRKHDARHGALKNEHQAAHRRPTTKTQPQRTQKSR